MFFLTLLLLVLQLSNQPSYSARLRFRADENGPPPLSEDPDNIYTKQKLNTAQKGLPKCLDCRKVAVIGAGNTE